jgi:hypothetical protein
MVLKDLGRRERFGLAVAARWGASGGGRLLAPSAVRTVADMLALAEWPAEQLRLVVERWQPAAEVRIELMR